jgi:hypothetical protein
MTGMLMEPEDAKRHAMQDQKIVIRIRIEDTVELKLCFEYIPILFIYKAFVLSQIAVK